VLRAPRAPPDRIQRGERLGQLAPSAACELRAGAAQGGREETSRPGAVRAGQGIDERPELARELGVGVTCGEGLGGVRVGAGLGALDPAEERGPGRRRVVRPAGAQQSAEP